MNEYDSGVHKSTSTGAINWFRCGTLATALAVVPHLHAGAEQEQQTSFFIKEFGNAAYSAAGHSGTAMSMQTRPYVRFGKTVSGFEEKVSQFYADLADSQESLGAQFSEVLADNLWDLYVRV